MKVDERTCVDLTLLLELDWPGSMAGPLYVSKTVDFERIAELSVESQTPDHLVGIELEFVYGPTYGLELFPDVCVGAPFPLIHLVMNQGVVHVVPDRAYGAHVERTIAEHPTLILNGSIVDHWHRRFRARFYSEAPGDTK